MHIQPVQACPVCSGDKYLARQRNPAKHNSIVNTEFRSFLKNVFQKNGSIAVRLYTTVALLYIPAACDQWDNPVRHTDPATIYFQYSSLLNLIFLRSPVLTKLKWLFLELLREWVLLSFLISYYSPANRRFLINWCQRS